MDFYHIEIKDGPVRSHSAPFLGQSGAEVSFLGVVREEEANGARIRGISYEIHPRLAQRYLEWVAEEAARKHSITGFYLLHSRGFVPVAEASLAIHIRARHRAEAFQACAWTVDELKRLAPIWKHPIITDPLQ